MDDGQGTMLPGSTDNGGSGVPVRGTAPTISDPCADTLRLIMRESPVEFLTVADAIKRGIVTEIER